MQQFQNPTWDCEYMYSGPYGVVALREHQKEELKLETDE